MKKKTYCDFRKVVVVGLGLLGGSIARACKKRKDVFGEVWGVSSNKKRFAEFRDSGAVDEVTDNLAGAVRDADLVIVCTPIFAIESKLRTIAKYAPKDARITDVGSVKGKLALKWQKIAGKNYVPSHPMAGSEKAGFSNGSADLFVNRPCILTPSPTTDRLSVWAIASFWKYLGGNVLQLDPLEHDEIIGRVSHVPHALIFSFLNALAKEAGNEGINKYAGSGFWDTTRIGASSPSLWAEILVANKDVIVSQLKRISAENQKLSKILVKGNTKEIEKFIETASSYRRSLKPPQ